MLNERQSVVKENITRAQLKIVKINEELMKLKEEDCNNQFAEIAINHVNQELKSILEFLNP
ncbi:MAG: hypothetical protein VX125_09855 [Pseudomonadota bacterium]|uniref:hypothetical protein n=1 Tax=Acinetobacter TaxID=469 RepID=UPI0002CEA9A0|nr:MULTISPECIES: hypothetical protein [Acinetobacter]ENU57152.1 hypothetical protein F981_03826 [Acinetobacter guillouiae CIP 63.46]KAB0624236.1 hypothetical protein F7P82_18160 [Acinetobacter guillouiae]MDI1224975.1 hypothetical protein [Acinetobacter sp.]MEC8124134.1 hypothetical protein [Pseudomonadota bacterium]